MRGSEREMAKKKVSPDIYTLLTAGDVLLRRKGRFVVENLK